MSETFEQTVTTQLKEIQVELKEHGIKLAQIEQREINGEKQEEKDNKDKAYKILLYRTFMGLGILVIAVFTALDKLGII